jgi:hypothetical protein
VNPRGGRLACTLKSRDGCVGAFSVYPGETPKSVAKVEEVLWSSPPQKEIAEGVFYLIGEMGMTGTIAHLNTYQWRALTQAKLEQHFYAAVLWGLNPMKVVEDAERMSKRDA